MFNLNDKSEDAVESPQSSSQLYVRESRDDGVSTKTIDTDPWAVPESEHRLQTASGVMKRTCMPSDFALLVLHQRNKVYIRCIKTRIYRRQRYETRGRRKRKRRRRKQPSAVPRTSLSIRACQKSRWYAPSQ